MATTSSSSAPGAASSGASASFFAKKKKPGKKSFKSFNANKIDASAVSSTVHIDAPPIANAVPATDKAPAASSAVTTQQTMATTTKTDSGADEWEDLPSQPKGPTVAVASGKTASELLDMAALQKKRDEEDDIAEKLRIEETRSQLQSAKEGMEREAKRLEEEKKLKKNVGGPQGKPRFGAAAAMAGAGGPASSGGKWIPPHMRGSGSLSSSLSTGPGSLRTAIGSNFRAKSVDTQDESAFPDLASADEILATKQKMEGKPAYVLPKKKPTAAGSAWGAKTAHHNTHGRSTNEAAATKTSQPVEDATSLKDQVQPKAETGSGARAVKEETEIVTKASAASFEPVGTVAMPSSGSAAVMSTPSTPAPKSQSTTLKKKKKKKDLSTFKTSSSTS